MANINILIAVDTKTTLSGSTTVYLEDDNPASDGSTEGTPGLTANVNVGDTIIWRATSINQTDTIQLINFVDETNNVFSSGPNSNADGSWSGVVGDFDAGTEESYTFQFSINNSGSYSWDPKIVIKSD